MKNLSSKLVIDNYTDNISARIFCSDFINGSSFPRFILGTNVYAESIAKLVSVDGFIDDFTSETEFMGKPILKMHELPVNSLVVSTVVGVRPLTAKKKLAKQCVKQLDYFAFRKYSGLEIVPVMFLDEFPRDFETQRNKYNSIYESLSDDESKEIFENIVNFRLSQDLKYLQGFSDIQYRQYFESFLDLKMKGETFVDVGGFDASTSLDFIERCPEYERVYIFEPEPSNMMTVKNRLSGYRDIVFNMCGLSNKSELLRFCSRGSSSQIDEGGEKEIQVNCLDDIIQEPITFLKMDIEGEEKNALNGARKTIEKFQPRIAISVYHLCDDLWKIPELILSIRADYSLYLRHYTEGMTETVMFFIPKRIP